MNNNNRKETEMVKIFFKLLTGKKKKHNVKVESCFI